jgi:hypothetical protein
MQRKFSKHLHVAVQSCLLLLDFFQAIWFKVQNMRSDSFIDCPHHAQQLATADCFSDVTCIG